MHMDDIVALFAERGHIAYEGEGITQLQHAWQCGRLARQAGAEPSLQLAAWLHDLGHLLTGFEGSPTSRGIDDAHEHRAAERLEASFGPAVSAPVALHVLAKRFLVATHAGYREKLSPDSVRSLALQGGPMNEEELAAFLDLPSARDALRLRAWDDAAKDGALHFENAGEVLAELRTLMFQVNRLR
jgi:phosphonate degradation associated HDIG domain protein